MSAVGFVVAGLAGAALALLVLAGLRSADHHAERVEWRRLQALQPPSPAVFSAALVAALPEPARRYFGYAIRPGAALHRVAEIDMHGRIGLGTRAQPGYRRLQARQILAAPAGFVWAMNTRGGVPISGSDTGGWTRFRLLGLIPIARIGGSADRARSAFGRQVAEAVFWTPAALLPGPGVSWQALGPDRACVTVQHGRWQQAVEVGVDADGRPVEVVFQRWSNANRERRYRLQPFGGRLADFREVDGFRLAHRVDAGNLYGTPDYFAFFQVEVSAIRFVRARAS